MIVFILFIIFSLLITGCGIFYTYNYKLIPGPNGNIGPKGDHGPIGAKGTAGLRGSKGGKGSAGPPGKPGGRRGLSGPKGPDGDFGSTGLRGFRGFRGEKGDHGERGSIGNMGRSGISGPDGPTGDPGDYLYIDIDYDKCKIYPFNKKNREMRCGDYEVLVEINNDINNYFGKCCPLKMSDKCINKVASEITKELTTEEKKTKKKYDSRFPQSKNLYHKYDCENGMKGEPQGNVYRCCKKENDKLNYNKDY